jgi:hypothetical protein
VLREFLELIGGRLCVRFALCLPPVLPFKLSRLVSPAFAPAFILCPAIAPYSHCKPRTVQVSIAPAMVAYLTSFNPIVRGLKPPFVMPHKKSP